MNEKYPKLAYRLQLNSQFTFYDVITIIPYLKKLGVTHIYLSPILKARAGSTHCYDIVDFRFVNDELGGEEGLRKMVDQARENNMKILIDIVPNHMAYSLENTYILDFIKTGNPDILRLFDIKQSPFVKDGKLIFPFLPSSLNDLLERGKVRIKLENDMSLDFDGNTIPCSDSSKEWIIRRSGENFLSVNAILEDNSNSMRQRIEGIIQEINSNKDLLVSFIDLQNIIPEWWQSSGKILNYRRFFAVNDMIALRSEDDRVIESRHSTIKRLIEEYGISGLRIDHLDGIHDPESYLRFLKEELHPEFIIIEKILSENESLSRRLKNDGTTGYDFLWKLTSLFTDQEGIYEIRKDYAYDQDKFENKHEDAECLVHDLKDSFMKEEFAGDILNLAWKVYEQLVMGEHYEFSIKDVEHAIKSYLRNMEKYRSYSNINSTEEISTDFKNIAMKTGDPVLVVASEHLKVKCPNCSDSFIQIQEYSGAVMAKSVEDRAFFAYNPVVFLNEVGGSVWNKPVSVESFIEFLNDRKKLIYSMNETSTHDTKYGEDLRASGIVIAEFPNLFQKVIDEERNSYSVRNMAVKLHNEHVYYIVQMVVASVKSSGLYGDYKKSLQTHIIKAVRESGIGSGWKNINVEYEQKCLEFAEKIVEHAENDKNSSISKLSQMCKMYGALNSISMLVLKFMLPGFTSNYQGSEYYNFHFTDPDNRIPVDFRSLEAKSGLKFQQDYMHMENLMESGYKLYLFTKLSQIREDNLSLINDGEILPLKTMGEKESCAITVGIRKDDKRMIIIAGRYFSRIKEGNTLNYGNTVLNVNREWNGNYVNLVDQSKVAIEDAVKMNELMRNSSFLILKAGN